MMDFWELGSDRVRVNGVDRSDLARLEPRVSQVIQELDTRLWQAEVPVDIEERRRPDRDLLADYTHLYEKEKKS